ncbi:uncharacterized protein BJ171DRAFT_504235 [Polychytrium aggregatum]|uniref:uncharacterized protein n=1 Tax=Polychytrium aggregatum TaxID=110093 RepID=UPI0022FE9282|nr:uncharacterized protein BJ171DRAFT_504235 [Polychytrium aggregatum]KAI9204959.1 hypothetical protein BJ171DRAFT_504235 [Polychytrium aggregatum]
MASKTKQSNIEDDDILATQERKSAQKLAKQLAEGEQMRLLQEEKKFELQENMMRRLSLEVARKAEDQEQQRRIQEELKAAANSDLIRAKSRKAAIEMEEAEQKRREAAKSYENLPAMKRAIKEDIQTELLKHIKPQPTHQTDCRAYVLVSGHGRLSGPSSAARPQLLIAAPKSPLMIVAPKSPLMITAPRSPLLITAPRQQPTIDPKKQQLIHVASK